ncbi:hypothetical protein [Thermaerobacillus caldiproteolyticus]|uniref:hypothetical protein n=1 Tax=Thermaerobacillus caldiproteolyticus TaxID=247480 RepID=UPI0018F14B84|nr:hypothetical protein [Anoxybacillus caldiproteolyticus]
MEEAIRQKIELFKQEIASWKKDYETADEEFRTWIRGRISALENGLNTLEDLLMSWEEYQKYGNVIPF